jgi:glutathione S-transferase
MTRSVTVEWYIKELQLDEAQFFPVDYTADEHKGDAFRKINPFARLPALVDGEMQVSLQVTMTAGLSPALCPCIWFGLVIAGL